MLNVEEIYLFIFFSALWTPFPVMPFSNEQVMGAINKAAKCAIIAGRNRPSCFLFCVRLFKWHHQLLDLNLLVTFNSRIFVLDIPSVIRLLDNPKLFFTADLRVFLVVCLLA